MKNADTSRTVLVVEDELFIRLCTVAFLEDAGFQVVEAANSAEALTVLAHNSGISALVTDVRMPGSMDGLGLVAQVQREHPVIRALVVSAHSCAEEAFKAGAAAFLPKPYLAQCMVRAVNDMLVAA